MAKKVGKIKLGHLTIKGVFRHMWDSPEDELLQRHEFRTKELGLFFRKDMCIGVSKKGKEMFSRDNHYPSYMIGLNLIFIKCWITIDWKVKHFEI
jgi:hypothetical protein